MSISPRQPTGMINGRFAVPQIWAGQLLTSIHGAWSNGPDVGEPWCWNDESRPESDKLDA